MDEAAFGGLAADAGCMQPGGRFSEAAAAIAATPDNDEFRRRSCIECSAVSDGTSGIAAAGMDVEGVMNVPMNRVIALSRRKP